MPSILFQQVDFSYESPYVKIFDQLSITIESHWKTALIGNNGRGKTTLLALLHQQLPPTSGHIDIPLETAYYPYSPTNTNQTTLDVIRDSIAPFNDWEIQMEQLLNQADETNLLAYGEILEKYQEANGYEIDALIQREMALMGLDPQLLERNFQTLSGGEQTRSLIIALFLKNDSFFLIDEPTNHLDIHARLKLGEYFAGKSGFIVASHDRHFLDQCTDHVVSINKSDVRVNQGNYSVWKYQMDLEESSERHQHDTLKREIRKMETAASQRRGWSQRKEKDKIGAYDKGFVGHRAAKVMKRALAIEHRIQTAIEDKKKLLKNVEKERKLKLMETEKSPDTLLSVDRLSVEIADNLILKEVSFSVQKQQRLAIVGKNGCGKTTLFRTILKELQPTTGSVFVPGYVNMLCSYQVPLWQTGYLRDHLLSNEQDETAFRQILGVLGVGGEIFEHPLETFSRGQLKKVDLCRSFCSPAHLLLWDEPINYIDIAAREQIESVILEYQPTLVFIEHDQYFVDKIATDVLYL